MILNWADSPWSGTKSECEELGGAKVPVLRLYQNGQQMPRESAYSYPLSPCSLRAPWTPCQYSTDLAIHLLHPAEFSYTLTHHSKQRHPTDFQILTAYPHFTSLISVFLSLPVHDAANFNWWENGTFFIASEEPAKDKILITDATLPYSHIKS